MQIPPQKLKKVLVLSNGYGEDQIACNLVRAIWERDPSAEVIPFPIVGEGLEYESIGLTPAIQNQRYPSGGFLRDIRTILKDLKKGLVMTHLRQIKKLKKLGNNLEFIIVVGDVFGLLMASRIKKIPIFFIPTAKSDLFMPHSFIERQIIKRYAQKVYTRDQLTADSLRKNGVVADYHGNAMMDHLHLTGEDFGVSKKDSCISLLPGSREEAYENLVLSIKVLRELVEKSSDYTFIFAKAKSLHLSEFKKRLKKIDIHLVYEEPYLKFVDMSSGLKIIVTDEFADALQVSNYVIGLAGTANEQAVYLGKSVVCFEGTGPQSSKKRFMEQQKLLGGKLHFIPETKPKDIANNMHDLFQTWKGLREMSSHVPKASPGIIKDLLESLAFT